MSQLAQIFFRNAQNTPDKLAIWCENSMKTYRQLAYFVNRLTKTMISKGVRRGDHIGVLLPNSIEFVVTMLAAADLGAVLVPLNTSLPASAVHRAFQVSDVKHVVASAEILKSLHACCDLDFLFVDGAWLSLENLAALGDANMNVHVDAAEIEPVLSSADDDPFILTMTSGSTGDPKPIILTQRTKLNRALAAVELYGVSPSDKILAATPLYHSLAERLVLIPLLTGGTSILMARYSPTEWLRCVSEQSVSFTIAVSSQLRQIAERLDDDAYDVSSLRCVVSSSAQLEPKVKEDLLSKLSCQFHECYGTSEIAIASNLDGTSELSKLKSVGKAVPGVEIKIIRDGVEIVKPGEHGEIVCKTHMIFGGYYKRPDLTANSMWGDFFRTGDLGMMDEDGYLYYLGRMKELIITGGINVYPKDIETVIAEHPSVLECSAFPLPDDHLGEIVAVAVIPRFLENFNIRALKIHCADRLADFQQPRRYFVLEDLPKNSMGKIMKRLLPQYCLAER